MTQFEIDQAVSRTLGEDLNAVRAFGFSMLDPEVEFNDPECDRQPPQVLDWDGADGDTAIESFHEVVAAFPCTIFCRSQRYCSVQQ